MVQGNARLRPPEASAYLQAVHGLKRTPGTLAHYRVKGSGPQYQRAGREILYLPRHLDEYAAKLLGEVVSSTSEYLEKKAS